MRLEFARWLKNGSSALRRRGFRPCIRILKARDILLVGVVVCLGLVSDTPAHAAEERLSLDDLRQMRRDLCRRPKRVIYNTGADDMVCFPKDVEVTVENLLARRTATLIGTHVDRLVFRPITSGFSHFALDIKTGSVLNRQPADFGIRPDTRNITQEGWYPQRYRDLVVSIEYPWH
jgi:hypothetical protein